MKLLNNFNKNEQYTIDDIVNNSLFELNDKKFYQSRKKWLLNKVESKHHIKFISLLTLLYDLSQNNFEDIYSKEKAEIRKRKIIILMKAYLHNEQYDEPRLISDVFNYMFEYDYFDTELLSLLKIKKENGSLKKYYDFTYLASLFGRLRYKAAQNILNMPWIGIFNQESISNYLYHADLKEL